MILHYGAYSHQNDSVQFTFQKKAVLSRIRQRIYVKYRVDIRGAVFAASPTQAACKTAIDALEAAYSIDGQDLIFKDDSDVATPHTILSANTMNGTRVVSGPVWAPGWKGVWGSGLEYYNRRSFRVSIEAEVSDVEGAHDIVSYRESSAVLADGGADFVIQEALVGDPQRQDTASATKQVARQFGVAVGFLAYPDFPSELYTASARKPHPLWKGYGDPQVPGAITDTHWPIKWDYLFEAASGLDPTEPNMPYSA